MKIRKLGFRANRAIVIFGVILFILMALGMLNDRGILTIPHSVEVITQIISVPVFSYLIASLFIRFTQGYVLSSFKDISLEQKLILSKGYGFIVYLITTAVILTYLGVSIQNMTLLIGIMATGFAFAIREVLVNHLAWFMILTKKPFRIGDNILIDGQEGKVIHIGTFYVVLDDTPDEKKDFIRIPNKIFFEKPIVNRGRDPFICNVFFPLKENSKGMENLQDQLRGITGKELDVKLETSDYVKILVQFKADSYPDRDKTRTLIIKELMKRFKFKS